MRDGKSWFWEYLTAGEAVVEGWLEWVYWSPSPIGDSCDTCEMVSELCR